MVGNVQTLQAGGSISGMIKAQNPGMSNAELVRKTQMVLDANGLDWDKAKSLQPGFQFDVSVLNGGQPPGATPLNQAPNAVQINQQQISAQQLMALQQQLQMLQAQIQASQQSFQMQQPQFQIPQPQFQQPPVAASQFQLPQGMTPNAQLLDAATQQVQQLQAQIQIPQPQFHVPQAQVQQQALPQAQAQPQQAPTGLFGGSDLARSAGQRSFQISGQQFLPFANPDVILRNIGMR